MVSLALQREFVGIRLFLSKFYTYYDILYREEIFFQASGSNPFRYGF